MLRSWISWRLGCTGKPASIMAKGSTVGPLSSTIQDHHSLTNNQYLSLSKAGSFSAVIFSSSESGLTFTNWKGRDWVEGNISAHILIRVTQLPAPSCSVEQPFLPYQVLELPHSITCVQTAAVHKGIAGGLGWAVLPARGALVPWTNINEV